MDGICTAAGADQLPGRMAAIKAILLLAILSGCQGPNAASNNFGSDHLTTRMKLEVGDASACADEAITDILLDHLSTADRPGAKLRGVSATDFSASQQRLFCKATWKLKSGNRAIIYTIQPGGQDATSYTVDIGETFAHRDTQKTSSQIPLDGTLIFSSSSECIAGGTLEQIYRKLDMAMTSGSNNLRVVLDAYPEGLPIFATSSVTADGAKTAKAEVRFPAGATWKSLSLYGIATNQYLPPESDSVYGRMITFLETPQEVQRVLSSHGFNVKLHPEYTELPDTYNSCGGSMQIKAIQGGAALTCGWGC